MKKTLISASFLLAFSGAAAADPLMGMMWGTEDVSSGVLCKVKDVTVLAQSADDCAKIGGEATHTVTMDKEPLK
ncbi:hypothetical protein [Roseibium sp.]|uniref:hypothetical protein n=1 Tax=Roseibium sp. TaxID=1936156 RepID=UPI003A97EF3D